MAEPGASENAQTHRTVDYSDVVPNQVSRDVYEQTKSKFGRNYQIYKVGGVTLRELLDQGKIYTALHGDGSDQVLDYRPPEIEVVVNTTQLTLEPVNQPFEAQLNQLDQAVDKLNHPDWLSPGEELDPEDRIEGVKGVPLPAAAVFQLAEQYRTQNGRFMLQETTTSEIADGPERTTTRFGVSCIDSPDGDWRVTGWPDRDKPEKINFSFWNTDAQEPKMRVLNALILPQPIQ